MTKVFVGNFSFSVDDDQLRDYFSKSGRVVSAKVMKEGQGGRSRGFGFVEFAEAESAEKAIAELNGQVSEGRVVKVSEDRSARRGEFPSRSFAREEGGYSGGGGGSHREGSREGNNEERGGGDYQRSSGPTGYFRAQPLDLGVKRKRKSDMFIEDPSIGVDYKDPRMLARFMSERGRILPRRMTGLSAGNQRKVTRAIKRAQHLGLLPFVRQ